MSLNWEALGAAVMTSRQALDLTQQALAAQAGVTVRTISSLESGVVRKRMPQTIGRIEKALTWEPGDARRALLGIDARPRKQVAAGPPPKSNLRKSDVDSLQSALDYTEVSVNAGLLRRLLAELALLRERLALHEPLPAIEEPEYEDCPF